MPHVTWEELKQAKLLLESIGGRVALSRYMVVCWGDVFNNMDDLSNDPRCKVSLRTLKTRIAAGQTLEEAAETPLNAAQSSPVVCWGEYFPSIRALANDPRCQVGYCSLMGKLSAGTIPEEAIKNHGCRRELKTIDEVLAKAQRRRKPNAHNSKVTDTHPLS